MNTNEKAYLEAHNNCGLKKGDYVKVVRCAGLSLSVEHFIGMCGCIDADYGLLGFAVVLANYDAPIVFSHFNLEKVEDEKPEYKSKPFDKVLVRDSYDQSWKPDIFSCYREGKNYPYRTIGSIYRFCIPYEGNEHLAGKVK